MWIFSFFSSREEKKIFLQELILKLNISQEEKDLFSISMDILSDNDFNIFFDTIKNQIENNENTITSIAPMSSTLL